MNVHPWNRAVWAQLTRMRHPLPHALLLHGMAGIGKRELALAYAQWLLCERPGEQGGCGTCRACAWIRQGAHPDLHWVEPEETEEGAEETDKARRARPIIRIDQIRALIEALSLSAHQGGWRLALIRPAEAMNPAAANALLKTLEEPPPRVMLILISHQPRRLLPTVLSRCHKFALPRPDWDTALAWLRAQGVAAAEDALREAGGAPLLALEYAQPERLERRGRVLTALAQPQRQDWSELAEAMKNAPGEVWDWISRWLSDLLALQQGLPSRYYPAHAAALQSLARRTDPARAWSLYRELIAARRHLAHPLNAQLLLESWFLRYASLEDSP
ncbi:MAG: DNA polymerase III subunit delta' [Burkholderiales bacterium]|nr:DNA polymerase III subunit delta' [Burkholderiales bacterium]